MKKRNRYHFTLMAGREPTYRVVVATLDGATIITTGTIRYFYIRHLACYGWEATGPDGHLGVHEHRFQAALALLWDRKGAPPFPIATSRQKEVVECFG